MWIKHGKNQSASGLVFCLLSPSGHVFHTTWETMIKSYNIGSGNVLLPVRRHSINWTIADFTNWNLGKKLTWKFDKNSNLFNSGNAIENAVCNMLGTWYKHLCVSLHLSPMKNKINRKYSPVTYCKIVVTHWGSRTMVDISCYIDGSFETWAPVLKPGDQSHDRLDVSVPFTKRFSEYNKRLMLTMAPSQEPHIEKIKTFIVIPRRWMDDTRCWKRRHEKILHATVNYKRYWVTSKNSSECQRLIANMKKQKGGYSILPMMANMATRLWRFVQMTQLILKCHSCFNTR